MFLTCRALYIPYVDLEKRYRKCSTLENVQFYFATQVSQREAFWGRRFALVFLGDSVIGKDIVAAFALLQEQNSPPPPIGIV